MVKKLTFLVLTLVSVGLMIISESLAIAHNTYPNNGRALGWELLMYLMLIAMVIFGVKSFFLFNQPRLPRQRKPLLPENRVFWLK